MIFALVWIKGMQSRVCSRWAGTLSVQVCPHCLSPVPGTSDLLSKQKRGELVSWLHYYCPAPVTPQVTPPVYSSASSCPNGYDTWSWGICLSLGQVIGPAGAACPPQVSRCPGNSVLMYAAQHGAPPLLLGHCSSANIIEINNHLKY